MLLKLYQNNIGYRAWYIDNKPSFCHQHSAHCLCSDWSYDRFLKKKKTKVTDIL